MIEGVEYIAGGMTQFEALKALFSKAYPEKTMQIGPAAAMSPAVKKLQETGASQRMAPRLAAKLGFAPLGNATFGSFVTKETPVNASTALQGYCVKDKRLVDIQDPQPITFKNGRKALSGTCPTCGNKVFRIQS